METFETRGVFQLLISLTFYIILGPVIFILCMINEIVRLGVSLYLQQKYIGKIKLVPDGADALWALKRKDKTRMFTVLFKLDKYISPQQFQQIFEYVILQVRDSSGKQIYSKFKQILLTKFGYACWKLDENFDLKNHFRSLSDKNIVLTKMDVRKELTQMFLDMSESRPQWEIITVPRFVENEGEAETSIAIMRFQHAYLDGLSILVMCSNYLGTGCTYIVHPQQFHIPFGKKALFYMNAVIFGPYAFMMVSLNKFKSFWPRQISSESTKTQTSYTWTNSIDLGTIQKLRKKLDHATISTILENAFISAAKEVLPAGRIPDNLSIGELAALLPYPNECPQNRFSIFMYNINSLQPDFERIRVSKKESWKGITGPWIPMSFFVFKISGRMPVFMHHIVLGGGSNSLMMSNLPLSKTKFRMLDVANVLEVWGFPPQPNDTGITLLGAAYENSVKISVSAESTWLKRDELEKIVESIPKILYEWDKTLGEGEKIL